MSMFVPSVQVDVPYWAVDNPQAVGAAEEVWVYEETSALLELVPTPMPMEDPPVQITVPGIEGLWSDVYHYATSIVDWFGRHGPSVSYITSQDVPDIINSAVGATIKSLSGFINSAAQIGIGAQKWASMQLDALDANIGAIYSYFDGRVSVLEGDMRAVLDLAVPSLQNQILQLAHDTALGFEYNSLADRQWATDHIFTPLTDALGNVEREIPIWAEGALNNAKAYTDVAVAALGANVLRELLTHAQAIQALATEAEQCTTPMCETMGPNTDLGKLLKGLQLALAAGALAEIADAREQDVADAITRIASHLATVIDTFETSFVAGGTTVAGLVADELKNLI